MGMLLGNVWGKTNEREGLFYSFFFFFGIDPFWQRFPVSSVKNVLCLVERVNVSHGIMLTCL